MLGCFLPVRGAYCIEVAEHFGELNEDVDGVAGLGMLRWLAWCRWAGGLLDEVAPRLCLRSIFGERGCWAGCARRGLIGLKESERCLSMI